MIAIRVRFLSLYNSCIRLNCLYIGYLNVFDVEYVADLSIAMVCQLSGRYYEDCVVGASYTVQFFELC